MGRKKMRRILCKESRFEKRRFFPKQIERLVGKSLREAGVGVGVQYVVG